MTNLYPTSYHTKSRRPQSIHTKIGTKMRVSTLSSSVYMVLDVLAQTIRQKKDIKEIQIEREVKVSLFTDDMILYMRSQRLYS